MLRHIRETCAAIGRQRLVLNAFPDKVDIHLHNYLHTMGDRKIHVFSSSVKTETTISLIFYSHEEGCETSPMYYLWVNEPLFKGR